jgi:hypothetical protein
MRKEGRKGEGKGMPVVLVVSILLSFHFLYFPLSGGFSCLFELIQLSSYNIHLAFLPPSFLPSFLLPPLLVVSVKTMRGMGEMEENSCACEQREKGGRNNHKNWKK